MLIYDINPKLAHFYNFNLRQISQKLVLRISPYIKQTICKHCDQILIPGKTALYRIRPRRQCHTIITCTTCGKVKRYVFKKPKIKIKTVK